MAKKLTTDQMRSVYDDLKRSEHPDIEPALAAEFFKELDALKKRTQNFTDQEFCDLEADNFEVICDAFNYVIPTFPEGWTLPTGTATKTAPKAKDKAKGKAKGKSGKSGESATKKLQKPVVLAEALLSDLDDEQCRALVKQHDREERRLRQAAELEAYKAEKLKSGATPESLANLTYAEIKPKRTISQIARQGAESLVHAAVSHMAAKKPQLKGHGEKLRDQREKLEREAAERVKEFALEQSLKITEQLKAFVAELEKNPAK